MLVGSTIHPFFAGQLLLFESVQGRSVLLLLESLQQPCPARAIGANTSEAILKLKMDERDEIFMLNPFLI